MVFQFINVTHLRFLACSAILCKHILLSLRYGIISFSLFHARFFHRVFVSHRLRRLSQIPFSRSVFISHTLSTDLHRSIHRYRSYVPPVRKHSASRQARAKRLASLRILRSLRETKRTLGEADTRKCNDACSV